MMVERFMRPPDDPMGGFIEQPFSLLKRMFDYFDYLANLIEDPDNVVSTPTHERPWDALEWEK